MNVKNYEAPEVEIVEVAVEQGFAASPVDDQITPPSDVDDEGL